jgi:hypothetical protein
MKLDDAKRSQILRLGIAAWNRLSTLMCHFILQQPGFLKKEIYKGIDYDSNRCEIKTELLTLPAAAHPSTTKCTLVG